MIQQAKTPQLASSVTVTRLWCMGVYMVALLLTGCSDSRPDSDAAKHEGRKTDERLLPYPLVVDPSAKYPLRGLLYGYIHMDGTWAIEPRYALASSFKCGVAIVSVAEFGPGAVIGRNGAYVLPPVFTNLIGSGLDGNAILVLKDRKWGLTDYHGRWVRRPQYDDVRIWDGRYVAVSYNGKWGVIDVEGNWVIEPKYDGACAMSEGVAVVQAGDKWGIIDGEGRWKVKPRFPIDDAHDEEYERISRSGLINMKIGNKWGYVDANGTTRIEPRYMVASPFSEERARAALLENGVAYWTYIRTDGSRITNDLFRMANHFEGGVAGVMRDDLYGVIDREGNWVIPREYNRVFLACGDLYAARKGDRWGVLNGECRTVVPFEYERFGGILDDGVCLIKDGKATWWLRKDSELVAVTLNDEERQRVHVPKVPKVVTTQPAGE